MRASNRTRQVIVGIFVIIGIAILVITILTLGSQRKTFDRSVTITSFFDNVNGLQKGNNIWFSGVKVGIIKKVYITGKGVVEVDMAISTDAVQFIRKDAKARLSTDGLIGNKIIEIYGGSQKAGQVEEGDILSADDLLSTDEMMATLAKNNDNLLSITTDFKTIAGGLAEGRGSLGKLLHEETLVNQLNGIMASLQKVSNNLQMVTANTQAYTAKLNTPGTLANDLVTDTVVFSSLRNTVRELEALATNSKTAIASFQQAGDSINASLNNSNTPLGVLLKDEKAANDLKVTMENLRTSSKKLDEDLEAIQHNFLLRGFFKKKAREMRTVVDTIVKP